MNHATPQMLNFARCLIAHQAEEASLEIPTATPVVLKLRPYLGTLMGNTGFCALLSRALALTGQEVPWLRGVEVNTDGKLGNFDREAAKISPSEITDGSVVLIAQLLGLLVSFIGEILTLQLVRDVWPDLPPETNFSLGDDHEKSN